MPVQEITLSKETLTLQLKHMQAFTRWLNSKQHLRTILQYFAKEIARLTEAESASILLYKEESRSLYIYVSSNHSLLDFKHIHVPIEDSIAGRIYATNESLIINDVRNEMYWNPNIDQVLESKTKSIAGTPLWRNGRSIGVIETINHKNNKFTNEHLVLLEMVADLACVAVGRHSLTINHTQAKKQVANFDSMKEEFLKLTSHELRTPLTIIMGYLGTMQEELAEDSEMAYRIDAMFSSCIRLQERIEGLLELKTLDNGYTILEKEPLILTNVINRVIRANKGDAISKQIQVKTEFPKKPAIVLGESYLLEFAIDSLISNAIKFTPNNGRICVGLEFRDYEAWVYVTDTGIGVPEEDFGRIFSSFYQVDGNDRRQFDGMGIGLAIMKELIELHDGRVWVEKPESNQGSTFVFSLPLQKE